MSRATATLSIAQYSVTRLPTSQAQIKVINIYYYLVVKLLNRITSTGRPAMVGDLDKVKIDLCVYDKCYDCPGSLME